MKSLRFWPLQRLANAGISLAAAVIFSTAAGNAFGAPGGTNSIGTNALAQMQALMDEKASWTPTEQKLDSQLIFAYKRSRNLLIANGMVPQMRIGVQADTNGMVLVDIRGTVTTAALTRIQELGGQVVNSFAKFNSIRALVPLAQIENIAALPDIKFIRQADKAVVFNSDPDGVAAEAADTARAKFKVDGSTIKVGVISDSVDFLQMAQNLGDLGAVTVLPGQSGVPGTGEGSAMLEIVHAMAPGAQLFFATASGGPAAMAQNILDLRAAGCDIICDDIGFPAETPFQDTEVGQAINSITASGALYFSAAGNINNLDSGNSGTWEGDFVSGGSVTAPKNGLIHNFGTSTLDQVTQFSSYFGPGLLFWSDPLGASTNDYDLYLLDAGGQNIVASSLTVQNGTQDPFEAVQTPFPGEQFAIVLASGTNRFLHLDTFGANLAIATSGEIKGHAASTNAFAICAVNAALAAPSPFIGGPANPIESFCSDGPRRIFYLADGTPITPGRFSSTGGLLVQKPDATAADGVTTSIPGFAPFFGTSAATPHAAAIAALLKQYSPTLTKDEIAAIFNASALDIMAPGVDRDSGPGIIMALQCLQAVPAPPVSSQLAVVTNIISGGNGNGLIDINECNSMDIVLTNVGNSAATSVQATLSTPTPGVTIAQRTQVYNNIPAGGIGTNLVSFKVSTSPVFACGTPISFVLVVKTALSTGTNFFTTATGSAGAPIRFDSTGTVGIPDNNTNGASSVINITNLNSALLGVTVSLNITHPSPSDLTLSLIGPDGTAIVLSKTNGVGGQNYGLDCSDADRTFFSDGPFPFIDASAAPFVGTFQPDEPLFAFIGKVGRGVNGPWQLHVVDAVSGNSGTINCWSMFLTPTICGTGSGPCPGVDLTVGLSAAPSPALQGQNMVYTIAVTNLGPDTAHSVSVNQTLPNGVTFISANSSQGTATLAGNSVSCNLGALNAGTVGIVSVVVVPTVSGTLFSTASVGSTEQDLNPSDNAVTIGTIVNPPSSDLAIGMTAAPNPVLVGGVLNYSISVTNNGPSDASNVVITNVLPGSVGILSTTSSQGSSVNSGNSVVTSLGSITKGSSATVSISVFPTVVGSITATAKASSGMVDPLPGNNSASATVNVAPAADISLSMVSVPTSAVVGSNVSYLILVSNHGPSPAANVSVSDTLPAGVTLVSATNSAGQNFVKVGQTVTFTTTNLPVNSSVLFTLTVGTASLASQVPLYITNTAIVSSAAADPNLANNAAVVSTRIDSARPTIIGAGARLVSESIQPTNGFIDPGETVSVLLNLQNIGNIATTNLVATLQASGGVNLTAGAQVQTYGALGVGAAPVARPFTFTAGTNISSVIATLKLQDGSSNLGSVQFTFPYPVVSSFANISNIVIPDHGEAAPYPSSILVSGVSGLIDKVTVSLTNFNHTFPDDVDVLLVGPAGQSALLMSHCGQGGVATNISLTFDDGAATSLTTAGQLTSGTFKPTQNGSVSFPASNTPAAPYGTALSAFNGTNANGLWSLYVYDSSPGDQGIILGGWSLGITAGTPVNQIVDLSVTGSGTPNPVLAGNNLTYTFTITNNGPNTANAVAFTNILARGVAFVSVNASQGTFGVDPNGAVYCQLTNLPVGVSVTVNVVGTPAIPGTITNIATITSADTDLNQFNNSAPIITTVTAPVADLALTMSATPNPVALGGNITYTVTVTNGGPGVALGVVASVPLGAQGFVSGIGFSNVGGNAVCQVGALTAGSGAALSFVTTPSQLGLLTSTVTGTSYSSDPNSANNSASTGITVVPPAPNIVVTSASLISESFLPPNGSIDPGETVNVAFHLANVGTADTTNLVVTLVPTNGITPFGNFMNNGVLVHGGPSVSDTFSFSVASTNTGSVTALLQLQDGGANLGMIGYTFNLPASNSFANAGLISIPDSGAATPYPSTISVSGITGVVSKATVTLNGFGHQFPNDVEILLVGPSGAKTVLMSGAGGAYSVRSATITFDDSASVSLPPSTLITNGTYRPTENTLAAPFPSPAPAGPYVASLGTFNGMSPNGTWALYVFDDSPGDSGSIVGGWSLNLTTVSPVGGTADLNITASSIPGPYVPGSNFVCNINVVNNGPDTATSVILNDALPGGWNVAGSVPAYTGLAGGILTFNLGQIAAGSGTNVSITFNAPVNGLFTNTFSVQANQFDFTPGNDTVATATLIQAPLILAGSAYATNNVFTFTLTGGAPNTSYIVLASPDLTSWTPVSTNLTSGAGTFQFQDPNAGTFARRYYRARLGP